VFYRSLTLVLFMAMLCSRTSGYDKKDDEMRDLRAQVAAKDTALRTALRDNIALIKANKDLSDRLAPLEKLRATEQSKTTRLATEIVKSGDANAAVALATAQANAEITRIASSLIDAKQTEFERQLTRVEEDIKSVVKLLSGATYLLVILTVLIFSFTGVIVYSTRRRPSQEPHNAKGG
jgi:hypothetical protein